MNKHQEALDRLCENNYFDEKGNCNCDLIVMDRILMQELVDKATPIKLHSYSTLRNLCEHFGVKSEKELQNIYLNKPYKFEDLKVGMWVWDDTEEEFIFIKKILTKKDCNFLYHDENKKVFMSEWYAIEFEENRFFPVQMANLRR